MTPSLPILRDAEIAVVGGGPAGSIAAFTLASAGHDVVVIDKHVFPRDKACGDGLTSSAVSFLGEMGLDEVLVGAQPIEVVRLCVDWREREVSRMHGGGLTQPCCIPRKQLDDALLRKAREAGADVVHGYVTGPSLVDGRVAGIELTHDGKQAVITARHVIAADGATSRMRRELADSADRQGPLAYAIRQYVRSDRSLHPAFELYAPLPDEVTNYGYGWVFPVGDQVANVGVGYLSAPGLPRPTSLTDLLASFLAGLRAHQVARVGCLEPIGRAIGGRFEGNFSVERCELSGVTFVGDAGRTTDPITGEGIDQAMRSAHVAALRVHQAMRLGAKPTGIGQAIAMSNPRLGQDGEMAARWAHQLLKRRYMHGAHATDVLKTQTPMFSAAYAMLTARASHPTLADTQAGRLASRLGLGDFLVALDERVRAEVRTEFVLGAELLYRELCGGLGPTRALVVAATQASCGREASELSEDVAVCVELLQVYANLLSRVTVDGGEQGRANNALALMIGDYGLSRAITAAARVGPTFSQWFGDAIVATCEGLARMMQYRLGSGPAIDHYMDSMRLLRGMSYSLAAKIGAWLADADQRTENALGAAGESLGVAVQVAEDILALTRTDPVTGCKPRRTLQEGTFALPVILAANDEPQIASLLREAEEGQDWEGALDVIRQGEGVAKAREVCRRYAADAKAATAAATGKEGPLVEVCDLPLRCLAPLSLLTPDEPHGPPVTGDVSPLRLAS